METELLKYFLTQGPFAILFVWLFLRNEKRNDEREAKSLERETKYQSLLERMTEKYDDIIMDLKDIKHRLK
ncbi:BhlA/UviB family holin-like peptide [Fictibacillus terranigra]|uniref:BhlA/UviB family holin-like peptide n=1 Tax=Fictibacillus terranigra TaxID=3058424 RepID=A0ABT8E6W4_9BACL|nr:BhlA/UviB family holin-like peptide [Fictibacillus sp. CENA-BCM004]MDN4073624.1 BhlA/UviB family holin-like peptide [Fictibacillus sp. CENA-BCM004]